MASRAQSRRLAVALLRQPLPRRPARHHQDQLDHRPGRAHEQSCARSVRPAVSKSISVKTTAGAAWPLKRYTDSISTSPAENSGWPNRSYLPVKERSGCGPSCGWFNSAECSRPWKVTTAMSPRLKPARQAQRYRFLGVRDHPGLVVVDQDLDAAGSDRPAGFDTHAVRQQVLQQRARRCAGCGSCRRRAARPSRAGHGRLVVQVLHRVFEPDDAAVRAGGRWRRTMSRQAGGKSCPSSTMTVSKRRDSGHRHRRRLLDQAGEGAGEREVGFDAGRAQHAVAQSVEGACQAAGRWATLVENDPPAAG